jgi:DNA-binding MarR family transcriptional regulator
VVGLIAGQVTLLPYCQRVDSFEPELVTAVEALRELILAGEKYRQMVTAYLGLDTSQTQALSYLYSRGEMGQGELGALLGVNTSTMTALVDRLERDGIAQRRPHPTDRRRLVVDLTDGGRQAIRITGRWFVRAFDHVEPSALPALSVTLTAIAADLRAHAMEMSETTLGR